MYMDVRKNRIRGTNELTWTIVLYLKRFTGLPKLSFFNFRVLDFPFARDSWKPTEQNMISK